MAKDIYWNNVVLGMHMDGADGSTSFTDVKGRGVSPGSTKISTTQSKFGGASGYWNGNYSNEAMSFDYSTDFTFGTGDFTIEAWIYPEAFPYGYAHLIGHEYAVAWGYGISVQLRVGSKSVDVYINGTQNSFTFTYFPYNAWSHVAVVRTGGILTVFLNGVSSTSVSNTQNISSASGKKFLVGYDTWNSSQVYKGYIDDLRVTNGAARYTADFTPPSEPFPAGAYEISGTVLDSNGNPVVRSIRAYDRGTGALVGSAVSSAANGSYSMAVATGNEVQVVMLDDVAGTFENDQILRTTPV